jgi:hypothetical protein
MLSFFIVLSVSVFALLVVQALDIEGVKQPARRPGKPARKSAKEIFGFALGATR